MSDFRLFLKYALPSMITMFIAGLYGIIDAIFIGRALGENALAAINVTFPIFCLIFGVGDMIGMGACILISQNRGAGNVSEENSFFSGMLGMATVGAILFAVTTYVFLDPILIYSGAGRELLPQSREYITVILFGCVFQMLAVCFMCALRNDRQPMLAMWIICTGLIFNIILDYFLVWHFPLGLFGAALATVIAQAVPLAVSVWYFSGKRTELKFHWWKAIPDPRHARLILRNGLPSLGAHTAIAAMLLFHNVQARCYGGIAGLAAYSVICQTEAIASMVMQGIASGIQPLASYFYGAGERMRNRRILRYALTMALSLGVLGCVFSIVGCHFFPTLMGVKGEAARIAARGLIISSPMFIALGLIKVGSHYFQATQKLVSANILIHGDYALALPLCLWVLPLFFGLDGVWAAMPVSRYMLLTVMIVCAIFEIRRQKKTVPHIP